MSNIRILALDIGTKTIGLALTDPLWLFAHPLQTVTRAATMDEDLEAIKNLTAPLLFAAVVLGWPLKDDGSESMLVPMVKGFERKIKKAWPEVAVYREDEHDSTNEAGDIIAHSLAGLRDRKRTGRLDAAAAAVILSRFMKRKEFELLKEKWMNSDL